MPSNWRAKKSWCVVSSNRFVQKRPSPYFLRRTKFFYRNKMEFAFGGLKDQPPLLGLRQKGKFDRIVDLTECRLLSPETGRLLAAVRAWAVRKKMFPPTI
jgi:tRNA/tmRNA/rRNA uracil-C5-methylase (TrmA/RlmC/RlmD family)